MKHIFLATALATVMATAAFATPGGEGNNTGCNGVGNPNSLCEPTNPGNPGGGRYGDLTVTNTNTNANKNANHNNNDASATAGSTSTAAATAKSGSVSGAVAGGGSVKNSGNSHNTNVNKAQGGAGGSVKNSGNSHNTNVNKAQGGAGGQGGQGGQGGASLGVGVGVGGDSAASVGDTTATGGNATGGSSSVGDTTASGGSATGGSSSSTSSVGDTTATVGDTTATVGDTSASVGDLSTGDSTSSASSGGNTLEGGDVNVEGDVFEAPEMPAASAASVFAGICQNGASGQVFEGGFSVVQTDQFCQHVELAKFALAAYRVTLDLEGPESERAQEYLDAYHDNVDDALSLVEASEIMAHIDRQAGFVIRPVAVIAALILLL